MEQGLGEFGVLEGGKSESVAEVSGESFRQLVMWWTRGAANGCGRRRPNNPPTG